MPVIELKTIIRAPIERCFLLSLSVDLHVLSTNGTNEKAIAGVTSGVMKMGDTVTWRAKHFGIYQKLSTKISAYQSPNYFVDEMVKGAFKKIYHQHIFHPHSEGTFMTDLFDFEAPLGFITNCILKNYMTKFLEQRNQTIKEIAEGDSWKKIIEREVVKIIS